MWEETLPLIDNKSALPEFSKSSINFIMPERGPSIVVWQFSFSGTALSTALRRLVVMILGAYCKWK